MFEEDFKSLRLDAVRLRRKSAAEPDQSKPRKTPTPAASAIPEKPSDKSSELKALIAPAEKNLHRAETTQKPFWTKRPFWFGILIGLGAVGLIFGIYKFAQFGQKIFAGKSPLSFLGSFGQLFTASDRPILGEETGTVNILILGIGGEGHEGANLSDTIILSSIKSGKSDEDTQVSLLSIPRDLIAKLPDPLGWRKINSAYAYGEFKKTGLGSTWITDIVQDLSGEKIPYYAIVDFSGFKQAVDDLGGIDVYVENSFKDSSYPDYQGGYLPPISFTKGWEHMSGERALQFTRSRHGGNGEGSDFARSKRQQKVLLAIREKAGKLRLSSLSTISRLLNNFADHFKTNFEPWGIKRLYDLVRNVREENIIALSLDTTSGIVCDQIDENTSAYILSYCAGKNSADLKTFIADRFNLGGLFKESSKVEIQNSTKVPGLAQKTENVIGRYNLDTASSNFPNQQAYSLTTIYDLTGGSKPQTLKYLTDSLNAYVATAGYPHVDKLAEPHPDFVIVLGADAPDRVEKLYSDMLRRQPAPEPFSSD